MSDPTRIAMVESIGGHRGNDAWLYNICSALSKQNCEVQLFTSSETHYPHSLELPFELYKTYQGIYGKKNKIIRGFRYLYGGIRSSNIAQKNHAQIAHTHIYHFELREYLNSWFFKNNRMKLVMNVHDVEDFIRYGATHSGNRYKKFENIADAVIVHSNYAKEKLQQYFKKISTEKLHVIPLADYDTIHDSHLTKSEARQWLNLPQHDFLVMFFGQIKKVKGLDVLIKAFAKFHQADAKLLIAGIPWKVDAKDYTDLVEKHGIIDHTMLHLNYHLPHTKPYYFRAADVIVLPYREIYSSGVLINAMNYGTPMITSDKELFKEFLKDGYDCLMFENENVNALAQALTKSFQNRDMLNQLSANAYETFKKTFDAYKAAERTVQVYNDLVGN